MADLQPNGLASLNAQRERARRSMPPPRHPVSITAAPRPADETSEGRPGETAAKPTPLATPATAPRPAPKAAPKEPAAAGTSTSIKVTLYVDRQADDFMESARIEGLVARPKVDISRSAVVRLALRRMMDEMSAAEAKELLERQEVRSVGPGRKRR